MDRPGVFLAPEGSGELGKMEETGCEIICGTSMTLTVKGQMMMMMTTSSDLDCTSRSQQCQTILTENFCSSLIKWKLACLLIAVSDHEYTTIFCFVFLYLCRGGN